MTKQQMRARTKNFAQRVIKVCEALPNQWIARTLGNQLLRCGTSVGANYRAVCRAKSTADFINKLRIVEEECDESLFWMELLVENDLIKPTRLNGLMKEGDEIVAIVVSAAKTTRSSARFGDSGNRMPKNLTTMNATSANDSIIAQLRTTARKSYIVHRK